MCVNLEPKTTHPDRVPQHPVAPAYIQACLQGVQPLTPNRWPEQFSFPQSHPYFTQNKKCIANCIGLPHRLVNLFFFMSSGTINNLVLFMCLCRRDYNLFHHFYLQTIMDMPLSQEKKNQEFVICFVWILASEPKAQTLYHVNYQIFATNKTIDI